MGNNKLAAINAWRAGQGLEPLQASGKTAARRDSGAQRRQLSNKQARAQANRDMKSNRQRKGK